MKIVMSSMIIKSVKSINQCKSVVQTKYDIVMAHGGESKVETQESLGTEFIITIPYNNSQA